MPVNNKDTISRFFNRLKGDIQNVFPTVVAETATEYFKEAFNKKAWNGRPWPQTKRPVKRGSLMVRSGALMASIRPAEVNVNRVVMQAGSSKVPYARVHNEGGTIARTARSETFKRNRVLRGKNKGRFKRGTTDGQGFSFKAFSYQMPARTFMGRTAELDKRIITRFKTSFLK